MPRRATARTPEAVFGHAQIARSPLRPGSIPLSYRRSGTGIRNEVLQTLVAKSG
jgi:hypothetical protein